MLKMIEVVGTSEESYSQAVKNAIDKLLADGEKVHFFNVMEHRGSVRDGKFKEFQAVIKVAIEY